MRSIPIESADGHLLEIVEKLAPNEEIILSHDNRPVAALRGISAISEPKPIPVFGRGKGTLIVLSDDDETGVI